MFNKKNNLNNEKEENDKDLNQAMNDAIESNNDYCELPAKNIFEDELEKDIKSELDTINSQYIRLAADFDNYRKRQTQERECLLKYGAEDTLKKLLSVLDTFDMAQKSIANMDDPEKIKENFNVVQKQFLDSLEKIGLQKIEAVGKEFDPNLHEAVMQTPNNDVEDHTVIAELQTGYMLCDRVLRPALVNVAVND